jgi:hypothetical protein
MRDKDAIREIANFLKDDPALGEEMRTILDLADKGLWDVIWKL